MYLVDSVIIIYLISFCDQLPFFSFEREHFIFDLCDVYLKATHSADNQCEFIRGKQRNFVLFGPIRPQVRYDFDVRQS
jgi:hypothetical protein